MICELCPEEAIIPEERGFAIRYMCGDCYALTDDEFHKKDAQRERNLTKQIEPDRGCILKVKKTNNRYTGGIPESQLALF